jgi:hypothetical protein
MIPTRATDEQHELYVDRIMAAYRRATKDQLARGKAWYPNARAFACQLAESDDPRDIARMAGVISALSPMKAWDINQRMATAVASGKTPGALGSVLVKVAKIMAGADPATVLPMHLKTGNFYRCIANPNDPDAVVIDRHAHDIVAGEVYGERQRNLSNAHRYATVAHAYREAARRLGVTPMVAQATTWTVQTQALAGTGHRSNQHAALDRNSDS